MIKIDDCIVTFIGTRGFDDPSRTDVEVLQDVIAWLTQKYTSPRPLAGIIYLHPITSKKLRGIAVQNLELFAKLVGPKSFRNIVIVTTLWDHLPVEATGNTHEGKLQEFWNDLIRKGSRMARSFGDRGSALDILER